MTAMQLSTISATWCHDSRSKPIISSLSCSKAFSSHSPLWLLTLVTQPPSFSIILHWLKDPGSLQLLLHPGLLHLNSTTTSYLVCSEATAPSPLLSTSHEVPQNPHWNLRWLWKWRPGEGVWFHTPWCSTCWKGDITAVTARQIISSFIQRT